MKMSLQTIWNTLVIALLISIVVTAFILGILRLTGNETTQRVRIYEIQAPHITRATSTMLFVGDVMLDRAVRNRRTAFGGDFPFTFVKDFISSFDVSVLNLEGPITLYPSKTVDYSSKILQFTFPPDSAQQLRDVGFDVINLANNHGLDFGSEGIRQTWHFATSSGLAVYGDPRNDRNISHEIILNNGARVYVVGFHQFTGNYTKVLDEIKRIQIEGDASTLIVVTPHWGEEYRVEPTDFQKKMAESWIHAGADIVIGHHPHVIQEIGEFMGKRIYYSLGNFVFDQDFSVETQTGLGIGLAIVCETVKNIDHEDRSCFIPHEYAGGIQEYVFSIVKSEPRIISGTALPNFVEKLLDAR